MCPCARGRCGKVCMTSLWAAGEGPQAGRAQPLRQTGEQTPNCSPSCRYTNSTDNDLHYWGLDYPPLSGYQVGTQLGAQWPAARGWLAATPAVQASLSGADRPACPNLPHPAELAAWQGSSSGGARGHEAARLAWV